MEIKNLKKIAKRILKAIKDKEKIILYGDADLDGVSSVIILKETIKNLGGEVTALCFPDREKEGYGISKEGLNSLKKFAPAILIALDCGISNFKEIKLAKKLGFEVMIIDHHEILDKLPEARIIVDPKQKGDTYPFKEFAAVGIVFKLSEILLKNKMGQKLRKNFLELVAIATLADMMPQIDENKTFIVEGLSSLEESFRPGIRAFFETYFLKNYNLFQKVSKIISILNVRDVENSLPAALRLLTTSSLEKAKEMIERLSEKNKWRKERIKDIYETIERKLSKNEEDIIFEGEENWDFTLISPVASILAKKYKKPAFIFKKLEKESQGTVRVPIGINSVALMKKCKKYLITYGGHPQASGFRIKNENLEKFKNCLIKNLKK
jgi:single-stranded-DNA-specific exonuclease